MAQPKVYADFHNADAHGRLRLNCAGTLDDLAAQRVELREGMRLIVYADDLDEHGRPDELSADATVTFSPDEHGWVAAIDWAAIRRASDHRGSPATGNGPSPHAPMGDTGPV